MAKSSASQSVTRLIRALHDGRDSAAGRLFELYFDRLVQLARKRLQNVPGAASQEEDVALRSFHSLCRRVQNPDRPIQVADRNELWRFLATRTVSRAIDVVRQQKPNQISNDDDVQNLLSREPTPQEAAEMADECRRLLDLLVEPELRQVALWKVEGYTNEEIAGLLDCVPRTVERKVGRIRLLWKHELEEINS